MLVRVLRPRCCRWGLAIGGTCGRPITMLAGRNPVHKRNPCSAPSLPVPVISSANRRSVWLTRVNAVSFTGPARYAFFRNRIRSRRYALSLRFAQPIIRLAAVLTDASTDQRDVLHEIAGKSARSPRHGTRLHTLNYYRFLTSVSIPQEVFNPSQYRDGFESLVNLLLD